MGAEDQKIHNFSKTIFTVRCVLVIVFVFPVVFLQACDQKTRDPTPPSTDVDQENSTVTSDGSQPSSAAGVIKPTIPLESQGDDFEESSDSDDTDDSSTDTGSAEEVISLSLSTVEANASLVASGSDVKVTLTLRDTDGNVLNDSNRAISFVTSGGTSTGSFSQPVTEGDGKYTASFTGQVAGTPTTVSATIDGTLLTSVGKTITVIPGALSLSQSTISVISQKVALSASTTITLRSRDTFGNDITVGGKTVSFVLGSGTSSGTIGSVSDHGDGSYSTNFLADTVGTPTAIYATIDGMALTSVSPTIEVVNLTDEHLYSTVTLSKPVVASGSSCTITLTIRDSDSATVAAGGRAVVFSRSGGTSTGTIGATSDLGNGTYTALFTGVVAGTATEIQASINGVAVTTTMPTLTVTPGAITPSQSIVVATTASIASGSTATIRLYSRDAAGNVIPSGGRQVAFTASGGTSTGLFSPVTDNQDGTYSASFTGLVAGTVTSIGATIDGVSVTTTMPTVLVFPGPISLAHSVVKVSSSTISAGHTSLVTLEARDANNNSILIGGSVVGFSSSGGTSTGTISGTTDHNNGIYTAVFTGTSVGTATTITATVNGNTVTSTLPTITVVP